MSQKILLISPIPSHPQSAGNRARIFNLLKALRDMGNEVHFVHIQYRSGDDSAMRGAWGSYYYPIPYQEPETAHKRFSKRIDQRISRRLKAWLGDDPRFNYQVDDLYDISIDSILYQLGQQIYPDVVIVEYVFFSKALECFPNTQLKIIDTHDIFANRYKLFQRQGQLPGWFSCSLAQEDLGLKRADVVIAIQDNEAKQLKKRLIKSSVITVGHLLDINPLPPPLETRNLLFIASSNGINLHTLKFFLNEIFPLVRQKIPTVNLLIAGEICDVIGFHDGCLLLGKVETPIIAYKQAGIVINPIQFGTGLKIKNIEALGYSRPLVTTSVGACGLEHGSGSAFKVADKPAKFAEAIIEICHNNKLYSKLTQKGLDFANEWNSLHTGRIKKILAGHKTK